jgi:hypothetical protein
MDGSGEDHPMVIFVGYVHHCSVVNRLTGGHRAEQQ